MITNHNKFERGSDPTLPVPLRSGFCRSRATWYRSCLPNQVNLNMVSIAPSQLFALNNKAILDDRRLNAVDSSGNWTIPPMSAALLSLVFHEFLNELQSRRSAIVVR